MARTTHAYEFEWKVYAGVAAIARRLAGSDMRPFLLALDPEGGIQASYVSRPAGTWEALLERLERSGTPYLCFQPLPGGTGVRLQWQQVDRSAMERLLGQSFVTDDFQPFRCAAPGLVHVDGFPHSWMVQF